MEGKNLGEIVANIETWQEKISGLKKIWESFIY